MYLCCCWAHFVVVIQHEHYDAFMLIFLLSIMSLMSWAAFFFSACIPQNAAVVWGGFWQCQVSRWLIVRGDGDGNTVLKAAHWCDYFTVILALWETHYGFYHTHHTLFFHIAQTIRIENIITTEHGFFSCQLTVILFSYI